MSSAPNATASGAEQAARQAAGPVPRCGNEPVIAGTEPQRAGSGPDRGAAGASGAVKRAGTVGLAGREWRWAAFGVVIAAAVMDLLDSTITQVAAPAIRRELGGSYAVIEWVTAAYALAMAAGLLTGGRLGDLFGRRRMLLIGIGMGMVFVPLFDIVMAGVRPPEMGSASGVLQTVNSLGMSLGIAGIGAIFFALTGGHGLHVPTYLNAAEWTALATVGLLACSFGVAFGLPRRAREMGAPAGAEPQVPQPDRGAMA
jgi:MFS family permease